MERATYTARWISPVAAPPLERGTITIAGDLIEAVEPHGTRTPDVDLGNVAIIPGLVNAHTHLDLTGARGKIPPTDPEHFCDWLMGVIEYRKTRTPEQVQEDIRRGLAETIEAGTTLIGDTSVQGLSRELISSALIRGTVFFEIIGLSKERAKQARSNYLKWVFDKKYPTCRSGASPHAPYSVSSSVLLSVLPIGSATSIHLAESDSETDLLEMRKGPFEPFLQKMGVFENADFAKSLSSIVENTNKENMLSGMRQYVSEVDIHFITRHIRPILFVHCNYLPTSLSFGTNQHIIFCPRTHVAFKHPPHPFREFLARGVNVALGTDSLASNPDLDLLAEARCVKARHAEVPGELLLRMATLNGAKALGWADECGSLEPGKSADLVTIPLANVDACDPHDLILGEKAIDGPRRTMFRGVWRN